MAVTIEGCITLVPCDGSSVNINLRILQANIAAWQALVGSRVQLNGTYGPSAWYVESVILSNDPAYDSECKSAPLAPSISTITIVGIGECGDTITSTNCCALLTNCITGQVLNVVLGPEGSGDYLNWETLIDHIVTTTNENYPGTWYVEGLCCMNAVVDPCLNITGCALGGIALDFDTVTDEGEDICPPNIYKLTNCQTKLSFDTDTNLYFYLNSVITIEEQPGCWLVETSNLLTGVEVTLIEGYDDCTCCLEPEPVKYVRTEPKADRIFYQIAESQCDITANIKFANAYYALFKKLKHGMGNCCDNLDMDKLWIGKQLSDYAVINNPAECIITTPVKPDVCPEPEGNPYIPPVPPVTYTFTVGAFGDFSGLFNCTECLDGSNPGLFGLCGSFNLTLDYNILDTIEPSSVYVFSYNGSCTFVDGASINAGYNPSYSTYTLTAANIINVGPSPENPCSVCGG